MKELAEEIQHRLLKNCGLSSISKIDKKGILHIFVSEAIHLGYIWGEIKNKQPDEFYIQVLEDMSKNWTRFSAPINTGIQLEKIN